MTTTVVYQRSFFADTNGLPLDSGTLYIGAANQDPEVNPIQVYWDSALTIPATQPLAITSGYVTNSGARAAYYVASDSYSLRAKNRSGVQVDYVAAANEFTLRADMASTASSKGAGLVGFSQSSTYPAATVGKKLQQNINPLDAPYSAAGDGSTNDRTALFNADAAGPVVITGNHRVSSNLTFANPVMFVGNGRLTIDSGVTVTFTYRPAAPSQRVFFGVGTVAGIKDFDAKWMTAADNSTDDTTDIQKIIACIGNWGIIRFSAGAWKITGGLTAANEGVNVIGAGRKATTIYQNTASAPVFTVTGASFSLSGMTIAYNAAGTSGGVAIDFNAPFYGTLDNVHIYQPFIGVQYRNNANSHHASRMLIESATQNSVLVDNADNVIWDRFQLINANTTTNCTLGCIRLNGSVEGCNFINGHTYQGVYSLTTAASAFTFGSIPAYNKFHAVYLDGATGCVIDKVAEIEFTDCWFSSRPSSGASITNADGVKFTGGGAVNCGQHGIDVAASASRVLFTNFSARSNSQASSGTYSGIKIAANTNDFRIQGCDCTNSFLSFGTQKYGIEVAAGTSDRYIVKDNLVTGNGTGGVSDGGSGANKSVANNY